MILTRLLLFDSAGILKVWTGLIVSPFRSRITIQDQIRIRLQDGYMEPATWPCPLYPLPTNRNHCSKILESDWLLKFSKLRFFFPPFGVEPLRRNRWWQSDEELFFKFFCFWNYNLNKRNAPDQIQEEGWEVQDGSTRVRRVVNSGETLTVAEGGRSGRRRGNVTLMWFVSFLS